jgi:hypothetical protein
MKAELIKRLRRIEEYNEIIHCFNRYLQYYALHHKPGVLSCFALEREDVSFEASQSGVFIGAEAISDYFDCLPKMAERRGILTEQHCVAPVVEFAGDGNTAKLTSLSPGCKVVAPARVQAWSWGKFYIDFVKLDSGQWKIWHMHWFETFEADMERGPLHTQFTQRIENSFKGIADIHTAKPTKPTSYFHLFGPTTRTYNLPQPPAPYETWEGMTDLEMTRPYQNPTKPETMEGEVKTVISLGKGSESREE